MNADSFFTISYRGYWINGHYDRDKKREVVRVQNSNGDTLRRVSSVRAAKQYIGRRESGYYLTKH